VAEATSDDLLSKVRQQGESLRGEQRDGSKKNEGSLGYAFETQRTDLFSILFLPTQYVQLVPHYCNQHDGSSFILRIFDYNKQQQ